MTTPSPAPNPHPQLTSTTRRELLMDKLCTSRVSRYDYNLSCHFEKKSEHSKQYPGRFKLRSTWRFQIYRSAGVPFLCLFTSKRLWSNKLCIRSTEICLITWYFTTSSYSSLPIKRHNTVVYRVLFFQFSRIQCGMIYLFLQLAKSQHSMFQSKMTFNYLQLLCTRSSFTVLYVIIHEFVFYLCVL